MLSRSPAAGNRAHDEAAHKADEGTLKKEKGEYEYVYYTDDENGQAFAFRRSSCVHFFIFPEADFSS